MSDGRTITARFRGKCQDCGATIKPGATIWYDGCWAHCKSCARELIAAADAQAEAERKAEETARLRAREEANAHRLATLNGYVGTIDAQIDAWMKEREYWEGKESDGIGDRPAMMIRYADEQIAALNAQIAAEQARTAISESAAIEAAHGPIAETVSEPYEDSQNEGCIGGYIEHARRGAMIETRGHGGMSRYDYENEAAAIAEMNRLREHADEQKEMFAGVAEERRELNAKWERERPERERIAAEAKATREARIDAIISGGPIYEDAEGRIVTVSRRAEFAPAAFEIFKGRTFVAILKSNSEFAPVGGPTKRNLEAAGKNPDEYRETRAQTPTGKFIAVPRELADACGRVAKDIG